jgi:transposase
MSTQQALALPSPPPSNTVVINPRCSLRIEADQRVIVVAGLPMHHYRVEDAVAEAYAMVFLVESGFAQQTDVARAFSRSVRTIRRYQERYAAGGMAALSCEEGWRRGRRRISGKRLRSIEMMKSQGMSNRAIAHRLGVSENAIRKLSGLQSPPRAHSLRCPRSRPPRRSRRRQAHRLEHWPWRIRRVAMHRRRRAQETAIRSQRLRLRTTMSRCR